MTGTCRPENQGRKSTLANRLAGSTSDGTSRADAEPAYSAGSTAPPSTGLLVPLLIATQLGSVEPAEVGELLLVEDSMVTHSW